jgi:hypothetical protein
MSVQKVNTLIPALQHAPRGALWAADVIASLYFGTGRVVAAVSAFLKATDASVVAARAARRAARDRDELMTLARRYQATQPEFAKDLFAAANNERSR